MERDNKKEGKRISLIQASVAFILFCGISALGRVTAPLFFLMILTGIAFPLIWAKKSDGWDEIGFRREKIALAIFWGIGAGLATSVYTYFVFGKNQGFSDMIGLQLLIGTPIWFLIMSPFQEFFFRGWLQPKFQQGVGKWCGLFLTSGCFTLWHFCPPFEGTSTSTIPITTFTGIISTFLLGVLFGYIFQRYNNILAPWIAHALAGVAAVALGLMSFLQYSP